jgi:transposase
MFSFPNKTKVYLAVKPVDMRKRFNGLWSEASEQLKEDPFSGALFVFTNKLRDLSR